MVHGFAVRVFSWYMHIPVRSIVNPTLGAARISLERARGGPEADSTDVDSAVACTRRFISKFTFETFKLKVRQLLIVQSSMTHHSQHRVGALPT